MKALALVMVGAIGSSAAAEPCAVELTRVPDDVRPVIEEWVAAEPRCAVKLTVRVVPTDRGLYVVASDPSGKIRERVAPDALTAAVLIASWVADDGAPVPAPVPAIVVGTIVDPFAEPAAVAPAAPSTRTGARTLALGAVFNFHQGSGVRVDLDVKRLVTWDSARLGRTAGVMLGVTASGFWIDEPFLEGGGVEGTDARALVQLTAHARRRRSEFRLALGAGAAVTRVHVERFMLPSPMEESFRAAAPVAEAALTNTLWLAGFGLRFGVVLSVQPNLEGDRVTWDRGARWRGYVAVVHGW